MVIDKRPQQCINAAVAILLSISIIFFVRSFDRIRCSEKILELKKKRSENILKYADILKRTYLRTVILSTEIHVYYMYLSLNTYFSKILT